MITRLATALALSLSGPALAASVTTAPGGIVRVLDKTSGITTDLTLATGQAQRVGLLGVQLMECRYPASNPSGNAYARLRLTYEGASAPLFEGWMIATAPALSALEHPRYDAWILRCKTS